MTAPAPIPPTPLTTRQHALLDAIRDSRTRRGCPPSPHELAALTQTPAGIVLTELETLRDLGWLRPTTPAATDPAPEAPSATVEPPTEPARPLLTPQQRAALQAAAEGCDTPAIASRIHVSYGTAKKHLASASTALGANNRTNAVAIAIRAGIIR